MKIKKDDYPEIYRRYTQEKQTLKQIAIDYQCTIGRLSQIIKKLRQETV